MSLNAHNHRVSLRPSKIEKTAMLINEMMKPAIESGNDCNGVSTASAFTPTSVSPCLRRVGATSLKMAQLAETRTHSRPLTSISLLLEVKRRGISAVNKPDEWISLDVTVDSGACVTVMPAGLCPGIQIIENDLSRNGIEYEFANGESIPNLGEKRCQVITIRIIMHWEHELQCAQSSRITPPLKD